MVAGAQGGQCPRRGRRSSDTGYCVVSPRGLVRSPQASHKQPTMRDCVQLFFLFLPFCFHTNISSVCVCVSEGEGMMCCSLNPPTAEARPTQSPCRLCAQTSASDRGTNSSPPPLPFLPSLPPFSPPISHHPRGSLNAEAPAIYRTA